MKTLKDQSRFRLYSSCFLLIEITSLVGFYAAGNYYVVRKLSSIMFHPEAQHEVQLPVGWLFWFLTLSIPFAYILLGIRMKDLVLVRTGLLLVVATIFTVRYYHEIIPIEYLLLFGGILLLIISYTLIKYLKIPRLGFTLEPGRDLDNIDKLQIESLAIAEIASGTSQQIISHTQFGGGTGGGGGAGGEF
ncbi:MAG: hypothetical protein C5B59_04095 [Bacteroidetes bacterium]|nr:MAG: hypothetical protein C5B59_04095 [Bacteroidota bacterium]